MRYARFLTFLGAAWVGMASGGATSRADVPTSSAFLQIPSRFMSNDLSLSSRGLGEICYSRDLMPDGTACNPAFSDSVTQGFLMGRIYLGNGYSALSTANSLVF